MEGMELMHCTSWAFVACPIGGLGRFVYDYQTLIAGAAAVAAAYYAARPVYRQLDLMRLQSDAMMRDMLINREGDLRQALEALGKNVGKPLNDLGGAVYWEEGVTIDEEQAFCHDQQLSSARAGLADGYRWRDSAVVEAERGGLDKALDGLVNTLDDVQRPAHTEKEDDDHVFTDEAWEAFLNRGEDAKNEVQGKLTDAVGALSAMTAGIDVELRSLDKQLTGIDRSLARLDA
jgi:hypothetical protein